MGVDRRRAFAPEGGDGAVGIEGADIGKGSSFMDSIVLVGR